MSYFAKRRHDEVLERVIAEDREYRWINCHVARQNRPLSLSGLITTLFTDGDQWRNRYIPDAYSVDAYEHKLAILEIEGHSPLHKRLDSLILLYWILDEDCWTLEAITVNEHTGARAKLEHQDIAELAFREIRQDMASLSATVGTECPNFSKTN